MQNITQSLAGRVAIFRLFPFDFQELTNAELLQPEYAEYLKKKVFTLLFTTEISSLRIFIRTTSKPTFSAM